MKSLDTNLLLRFLLHDHPTQSAAITTLIQDARPHSFVVADVALFEAAWVMQGDLYRLSRTMVTKLLRQLIAIEQISCNRQLLQQALPLYEKHSSLSLVDVALCVYAETQSAIPLLTYDKKLARSLPQMTELLAA